MVLGVEGSRGTEDVRVMGSGAVVARAGIEDAGIGGSSVCTTGGGYFYVGKSTVG